MEGGGVECGRGRVLRVEGEVLRVEGEVLRVGVGRVGVGGGKETEGTFEKYQL